MYENNILRIKARIEKLLEDENGPRELRSKLHEKGVEFSVLLPIFEYICEFDPLTDIEYEASSLQRVDQRFDFLIDGCFLVEAKSLDSQLTQLKKQISDYILLNDQINFGILSNGYQFIFFLQKTYIKSFLKKEEELTVPIKKDVIPVLELSIDDPKFYDVMRLFHKEAYKTHFNQIASYVLSCYNKGKAWKICDDRELNDYLKDKIKSYANIQTGHYLKEIKSGQIKPNDKLAYFGDGFEIFAKILVDGRIDLTSINIIDFKKVKESPFRKIIELEMSDWVEEVDPFLDPMDIFKEILDRKRLSRDSYKFEFKTALKQAS